MTPENTAPSSVSETLLRLIEVFGGAEFGWLIFALCSYAILVLMFTIHRSKRVADMKKLIIYIVGFFVVTFLFYIVYLDYFILRERLAHNIALLSAVGVGVAIATIRWSQKNRNLDRVIGAAVSSAVYFAGVAIASRYDASFGHGVGLGAIYGLDCGFIWIVWSELYKSGELMKVATNAEDKNRTDSTDRRWERSRKM